MAKKYYRKKSNKKPANKPAKKPANKPANKPVTADRPILADKPAPANGKKYQVSILKDHDFDFQELMDWIKLECKGKFYYRRFTKNVVFTFFELDDGFKFKMRWEIA